MIRHGDRSRKRKVSAKTKSLEEPKLQQGEIRTIADGCASWLTPRFWEATLSRYLALNNASIF